MQRKTGAGASNWVLVLIAAAILGGIWLADQMAHTGAGPNWLQALLGTPGRGAGQRVGLVAGHQGNDSGAVCPDGLTEVSVNTQVAALTAERLRQQGLQVDILDEFDARLQGYRAAVLVSIHSDSCSVDFSGFKVARYQWGSEASERLAQCLWDSYEAETGLARHPDTVTLNMTRYHAFRKIAASTPAAIIELGFLNADRDLLTGQPGRAAAGVASGILCFLETPQ